MTLRGETVVGVDLPGTGFCRRGIETLAEDASVADVLALVERSCTSAGTTQRNALCQAIEKATQTPPNEPARLLRVLFAEVERMLARFWTLALSARAANLQPLFHDALEQREILYTALDEVTGTRQFWGVATPGGARTDLDLNALRIALKQVQPATIAWHAATSTRGALGRAAAGAGTISADRAEALHLTGLAASGLVTPDDLRQTHPYGGYVDLKDDIEWPVLAVTTASDAATRLQRAVDDIAASCAIASLCLSTLAEGKSTGKPAKNGATGAGREASARAEGSHGPVEVAVTMASDDRVARLRLETPGASLMSALPEILEGAQLSQVPLILASLDLCAECFDH